MYRLLREAGQVRERRAQAAHPARTKPELIATGPNEVWSWDITKLAGPQRGVYYHLYVMIDIFSRCAVHSEVHATELGELAKDFMTEAVRLNGGTAPMAIHADRGTSMTSKPVSALLSDLAILKTHSDERTGRRLARAIQGRGAFRRFKDVSAHLADRIINIVTVIAPNRYAAVAVARAVVSDALKRQAPSSIRQAARRAQQPL